MLLSLFLFCSLDAFVFSLKSKEKHKRSWKGIEKKKKNEGRRKRQRKFVILSHVYRKMEEKRKMTE